MSKAWEMDIPTGQKMLLLALCDHANDDGACYPSQDKLAIKCSMGARTVIAHIKWLEEHGIISRERRQSTQRRKSDLYQICLDNYTPAPANSAPANSAPANFSPEPANFAPSEPANFAPSYIDEPSVFNHQIEPSEIAGQLSLTAAPAELIPPEKLAKRKTTNPDNAKTWEAYRQAYLQRYGVEPIRNAQSNALIANLVKLVGGAEAPQLAWFYVWHNKGWYVQNRHALKHLIADVQAVRTDWLRNEQMTAKQAMQAENTQANLESHKGALEILRAKGVI